MFKITTLILIIFAILIMACSSSTTQEINKKNELPEHHLSNGRFQNPAGSPANTATFIDTIKFLSKQILDTSQPEVPNNHVLTDEQQRQQIAMTNNPSITWLGHASFIIRTGGKVILTDPYLQKTAGPWGLGPKRFVDSPLQGDQLPKADVMLISHNHYDHLDAKTVEIYPWKAETQIIVPIGLGEFFIKRGYKKVLEQDWFDRWNVDNLAITTLPAIHFSGRSIGDKNKTLWASFAITSSELNIWFSGDTARGKIFHDIGRRVGPFDYALVAIGAYAPRKVMQNVHVTPEEAIEISRLINAKKAIGMHWGTIMLTPENPFEAPARFRQAARDQGFGENNAWILKIGETRAL